jgi:hypothetical protein
MLKQIILDKKEIPIKYHGKVTHIVFECNFCHKSFMQKESYYKKQLKRRKYACCFCSPGCRTKYQISDKIPKKNTELQSNSQEKIETAKITSSITKKDDEDISSTKKSSEIKKRPADKSDKNGFFSSFLKGLLGK